MRSTDIVGIEALLDIVQRDTTEDCAAITPIEKTRHG